MSNWDVENALWNHLLGVLEKCILKASIFLLKIEASEIWLDYQICKMAVAMFDSRSWVNNSEWRIRDSSYGSMNDYGWLWMH